MDEYVMLFKCSSFEQIYNSHENKRDEFYFIIKCVWILSATSYKCFELNLLVIF